MVKFALFALLCLAPSLAQADDSGRSEYQTGSRYFDAEEFDAALPLFQIAYERSGKRPATIFALAQCERALKRYAEAIVHFKEYLATGPDNDREVRETVELLEEIEARNRASQEAEAAEATQQREAEQQAQAAQQAELERRVDEERQKRKAAEQSAALERSRRERAEQQAATPTLPAAPAPTPATAPPIPQALTERTPEADSDSSLLSSPVFWVVTVAVVAGGAVAAGLALKGGNDYAGTSGVVLEP